MPTTTLPPTHLDEPGFIRTADGVRLFYRDWGNGDPVLFVGSWSLPSDMWNYQMLALSEQGLRCIAYDRRGHGRSSDPGRGYDFDTLADDLAAVLDALDLRRVTLVGHSMGNGEITRYLSRHGSARIARIAMLGTITPMLLQNEDYPHGVPAAMLDAVRSQQLMKNFPLWIDDNMAPFLMPDTPASMADWIRQLALATSAKALVDCQRAVSSADFRQELRRIERPTLIIHGDRDVSGPLELTARPTAALVPGAVLTVYPGAPHGLFVTHHERVNADLLAFIRAADSVPRQAAA